MASACVLLQEWDVNGDGTIDYEEFLAATINMGKLEREEHLKRAFEHFDLDGDGQISHSEIKTVRCSGEGRCGDTTAEVDTQVCCTRCL